MTSNIMLTLAFLAGVLAVCYLTPKAGRQWILLAASLLFYLSADPRMLLLSGGKRALVLRGRHRHGTGRDKGTEEGLAAGGSPSGASGSVCI